MLTFAVPRQVTLTLPCSADHAVSRPVRLPPYEYETSVTSMKSVPPHVTVMPVEYVATGHAVTRAVTLPRMTSFMASVSEEDTIVAVAPVMNVPTTNVPLVPPTIWLVPM